MRKTCDVTILWTTVVLQLMLIGCQESSQKGSRTTLDPTLDGIHRITINDLDPRSTINIDSILETVHYIPLETTEESIIGKIDEVVVTDDYLIVLDVYQTQSIFVFDRSGKFLHKIHRIGKGPGEFNQPSDIAVNEKTKEVYLLNEYPQKIIKYSYDGQFTGEIQLPIRFTAFALMENDNIVLMNEANCRKYGNPQGHPNAIFSRLLLITPEGKTLEKGGPVNQAFEENNISKTNFGLMKNEKISYSPLFNDTLFELDGNESHPSLIVDFGKHTLETQKIAGLTKEEFFHVANDKDYYHITGQHSQTPEFVFLAFYSGKQDKSYNCIYNRGSREFSIFRTMASHPSNPMHMVPQLSVDNYTISIIPAQDIMYVKNYLAYWKEKIPKKALKFCPPQELLDRIDENSNPVLGFYTLRPEKINAESVYLAEE